jgi:nucleoside-diphosphate-sugar epimerase
MRSRIIVLGASGFIGRRVVHALSQVDWAHPVAVSRNASASLRGGSIETADIDISAAGALRSALAGAAGVVNCIAGAPELILSSTRALLDEAAALTPPPRVVNLSSLAAYGSVSGTVDESAPLLGDLDAYSAVKAETDRLAAAHDFALTLRPGIVFGPASPWWSDRIARLLVAGRLGDLGPDGDGICNLVYVDDVARAALLALRLPGSALGAFNLSTSEPLTWNEYFARFAAALGALPVRRVSKRRLTLETRVFAPPLKAMELLLRYPALARWNPLPPIRPWLPDLCAKKIRMDVSRAERLLGVTWTELDTALGITAQWFTTGGRTGI